MLLVSLRPWYQNTPWQGTQTDVTLSLGAWGYVRRSVKPEDFNVVMRDLLSGIAGLVPVAPGPQGYRRNAYFRYGGMHFDITIQAHEEGVDIFLTDIEG